MIYGTLDGYLIRFYLLFIIFTKKKRKKEKKKKKKKKVSLEFSKACGSFTSLDGGTNSGRVRYEYSYSYSYSSNYFQLLTYSAT